MMFFWVTSAWSKRKRINYMRHCFAIIFGLVINSGIVAQTPPIPFTDVFAFSVQSIDDFFDRFNARKNTAFTNYLSKNFTGYEIKRERLILSLFDYNYLNSNHADASSMIMQVTDTSRPQFLRYDDNDWFAEVECKVYYKGIAKTLEIVLKVEKSGYDTYHWAIVSAKADFLNRKLVDLNNKSGQLAETDTTIGTKKYFLSPVSHGIDFVNLRNVFINKTHVEDYIYKGQRSASLINFISLVKSSQLKFQQANRILYKLVQIEGWIIEINYFNRDSKNSGWLISKLTKVLPGEKNSYLKKYLEL